MSSAEDSVLADGEDKEWDVEFHGTRYLITVRTSAAVLSVDAEQYDTNDRWSAEFTSQYVEEITHKAGNFKKFGVFVKMLMSAFSNESESVFVDILTYSDLEILRARKTAAVGASGPPQSAAITNKAQLKRYVILTYAGEFDRVHYPLPLAFEEVPNAEALKRTVIRLRKRLAERAEAEGQPNNDKERELRQTFTQLRQENTELKHRLRQVESRAKAGLGSSSSHSSPGAGGVAAVLGNVAMTANAELTAANSKLKKTVEALRRELEESALAYEKLRVESVKEITKWKMNSHGSQDATALSGRSRDGKHSVVELMRRVEYLEQQLRIERSRVASGVMGRRSGASSSPSFSRTEELISSRALSASKSRGKGTPGHTSSGYGGSSSSRYMSSGRALDTSPGPPRRSGSSPSAPRGRSSSPLQPHSPSSSRFGRFDPTEYHKQKMERERSRHGSASKRYDRESGYSSASSTGSRASARSRSQASSRSSSRNSRVEDGPGRTVTKTSSKKASVTGIAMQGAGSSSSSTKKKTVPKKKASSVSASIFGETDVIGLMESDRHAHSTGYNMRAEADNRIKKKQSSGRGGSRGRGAAADSTPVTLRSSATGSILHPEYGDTRYSDVEGSRQQLSQSQSQSKRESRSAPSGAAATSSTASKFSGPPDSRTVSASAAPPSRRESPPVSASDTSAALASLASRIDAVAGRVNSSLESLNSGEVGGSHPVSHRGGRDSSGLRSSYTDEEGDAATSSSTSYWTHAEHRNGASKANSATYADMESEPRRARAAATSAGASSSSSSSSSSSTFPVSSTATTTSVPTTSVRRSFDQQSAPSSPARLTRSSLNVTGGGTAPAPDSALKPVPVPVVEDDLVDIDKRILALQNYLDNARNGIISGYPSV